MLFMLLTGMPEMDAERAFAREARARRRAALVRRLRRVPAACARLAVYDERSLPRAGRRAVREIPLDAITGTVEPSRVNLFDGDFRLPPAPAPAGSGCGWRSTAAPCCRRSPSCASATRTRCDTATTGCRWRAPAGRSRSMPRSRPPKHGCGDHAERAHASGIPVGVEDWLGAAPRDARCARLLV